MALADLLQQDAIIPALKANSKKQLLQELAAKAAKVTGLPEREIFDVILQRERLGSTGVGNGIAIPHGKLTQHQVDHRASLPGLKHRSISKRWTTSRSIWSSCFSRPKAPAPIISRRCRGSPACCATRIWWPSCAPPNPLRRSTLCWRICRPRTRPEGGPRGHRRPGIDRSRRDRTKRMRMRRAPRRGGGSAREGAPAGTSSLPTSLPADPSAQGQPDRRRAAQRKRTLRADPKGLEDPLVVIRW